MSSELRRTASNGEQVRVFDDAEDVFFATQDIVGKKWQPLLVYHLLQEDPLGFSDLKGRIDGISSKMLSESLDHLESAGLVDRTVLSDSPVRVEYTLTEAGERLEPLIAEMVAWGRHHTSGQADGHGTDTSDPTPLVTDGGEGR